MRDADSSGPAHEHVAKVGPANFYEQIWRPAEVIAQVAFDPFHGAFEGGC